MHKSTLRKERSMLRVKVYDIVKFLLKNKGEKEKVQDVFQKVALEFNYERWECVEQVYRQQKKKDKDPLPNFKKQPQKTKEEWAEIRNRNKKTE